MLDWLRKREREDVQMDVPGVKLVFNHRLKIAVLYDMDSDMPENRYAELEKHLNKQHYVLQIIVASRGMPIPLSEVS